MKRSSLLLFAAVVLSFVGMWLSGTLLSKHLRTSGTPSWINSLCESGEGGSISCDAVLSSRWATIPPTTGDPNDHRIRIPVASLGVAYFTLLCTWYVCVGRPNYSARRWQLLPLLLNGAGLAGSVAFIGLMAFSLEKWCPLCVATHVVNLLLFVVNVLLRPSPDQSHTQEIGKQTAPPAKYPSTRLALVTIGLGIMFTGSLNQSTEIKSLDKKILRYQAALKEVQRSTETLVAMYESAPLKDIKIRPDDPIRNAGNGFPTLVIWSDFECSHCREFVHNLDTKYAKEFDGYLQIVFKNYPLSSDCNPNVKSLAHAHACKAARLAEAARIVGGNEKFWQAHDLLFENQAKLGKLNVEQFATSLSLDPARMAAAMNSDAVTKRIAEDVKMGHDVGVTSTPAVFLAGRRVTGLVRRVPAFWNAMGKFAQRSRAKRQYAKEHATHN